MNERLALQLALALGVICAEAVTVPRLCYWNMPRAAIVRQTLYLDGGEMAQGGWDGTAWDDNYELNTDYNNVRGNLYALDLNQSFAITADFEELFYPIQVGGGGNDNPPFRSGFLFSDDYELYTYGGLSITSAGENSKLVNKQIYKDSDSALDEALTVNNPDNWFPQSTILYEPEPAPGVEITRYITHGAGASVPGTLTGYYFSGAQVPGGGYIDAYAFDPTKIATEPSNKLITVDMSTLGRAVWDNITIPDEITPRAGGQLVYLPVAREGLLVAIGGVTQPRDLYGFNEYPDTTITESTTVSPSFMRTLPVFDPEAREWFLQETTAVDGEFPPQLSGFCAVVAHEVNMTSFQIHVYGGYNGYDMDRPCNNDVWILSVPGFQWVKAPPSGTPGPSSGRYGHVCAMPYPDQMFVVGGIGPLTDQKLPNGTVIEVYNLNTLQWQASYDPNTWSDYVIPNVIRIALGDPSQKADGMNDTLAALFDVEFGGVENTWYPYTARSSSNLGVIIGATLGGAAAIVAICLSWWFVKRRKDQKRQRFSKTSSATAYDSDLVVAWDDGRGGLNPNKAHLSSMTHEVDSTTGTTPHSSWQIPSTLSNEPLELNGAPTSPTQGRVYSVPSPARPVRALVMSSAPPLPQPTSVEMEGEPRQEMRDTSKHLLGRRPSDDEKADYRFKNHPLYPHTIDELSSVSEPISSANADMASSATGSQPPFSPLALPQGAVDSLQNVYLGTLSSDSASHLTNTAISEDQMRSVSSENADTSAKARPQSPRHDSNASSTFVVTPVSEGSLSSAVAASMGLTAQRRPSHHRNVSSLGSAETISNPSLPSPPLEADRRISEGQPSIPISPPLTTVHSHIASATLGKLTIPTQKRVPGNDMNQENS